MDSLVASTCEERSEGEDRGLGMIRSMIFSKNRCFNQRPSILRQTDEAFAVWLRSPVHDELW
jgi:hypothetical protein